MNKNTTKKTIKLVQGIGNEINWTDEKKAQLIESILISAPGSKLLATPPASLLTL